MHVEEPREEDLGKPKVIYLKRMTFDGSGAQASQGSHIRVEEGETFTKDASVMT